MTSFLTKASLGISALLFIICFALYVRNMQTILELNEATEEIILLKNKNKSSEEVIKNQQDKENDIRARRKNTDKQLDSLGCSITSGNASIDDLLRMLAKDKEDRCGKATGSPAE